MRILLSLSVALALAGCAGSTAYVKSADPCDAPVLIPERWLSDLDVERLWLQDRQSLLDCADQVEVLSGRAVGPQ